MEAILGLATCALALLMALGIIEGLLYKKLKATKAIITGIIEMFVQCIMAIPRLIILLIYVFFPHPNALSSNQKEKPANSRPKKRQKPRQNPKAPK